jgi:hypothetical protein
MRTCPGLKLYHHQPVHRPWFPHGRQIHSPLYGQRRNDPKETEYVLVGTLMSFASAAIIGVIIAAALK